MMLLLPVDISEENANSFTFDVWKCICLNIEMHNHILYSTVHTVHKYIITSIFTHIITYL